MSDNLIPGVELTEDDLTISLSADVSENHWLIWHSCGKEVVWLGRITVTLNVRSAREGVGIGGWSTWGLPHRLGNPMVRFDGVFANFTDEGEFSFFEGKVAEQQPYNLPMWEPYDGELPEGKARPTKEQLQSVVDQLCRKLDACFQSLLSEEERSRINPWLDPW